MTSLTMLPASQQADKGTLGQGSRSVTWWRLTLLTTYATFHAQELRSSISVTRA